MVTIEKRKYSTEPFKDYAYRARVSMTIMEIRNHKAVRTDFQMDVYTTCLKQKYVQEILWERCAENVMKLEITWWSTREQDEACTALIDEMLNKSND